MHGSRKCCGELAELTVDDIWKIADGDQELQRLTHSSRGGTMELGGEDTCRHHLLSNRGIIQEKISTPAKDGGYNLPAFVCLSVCFFCLSVSNFV